MGWCKGEIKQTPVVRGSDHLDLRVGGLPLSRDGIDAGRVGCDCGMAAAERVDYSGGAGIRGFSITTAAEWESVFAPLEDTSPWQTGQKEMEKASRRADDDPGIGECAARGNARVPEALQLAKKTNLKIPCYR